MDIRDIITGWKNVIWTDAEIEILSAERMKVCNECPSMKIFDVMNIKTEVCGECHCPLKAKTRSPKTVCPLKKWKL